MYGAGLAERGRSHTPQYIVTTNHQFAPHVLFAFSGHKGVNIIHYLTDEGKV